MENYKVKRNPKPLSDEQINRHKDFDKLLGNHQKLHRYKDATKPLYKNIGFMCMMAVIGIVLLMLLLDHKEEPESSAVTSRESLPVAKADTGLKISGERQEQTLPKDVSGKNSSQTKSSGKISAQDDPALTYEIFRVNPENGAVLYTQSGLRILIPALAFSDGLNNPVRKEVTVKFREFILKEEGQKFVFVPFKNFELLSVESSNQSPLNFSKPVQVEIVVPVKENGELLYTCLTEKNCKPAGKKDVSYRFMVQANESQFPELVLLKELLWEIPSEAGTPSDFNYIFNRSWKGFSFKTTDKKELAVKSTNSSFKGVLDLVPLLGDPKQDLRLREAFYSVYNFSIGKNTDQERQKQALETIESWKNSTEGKQYIEWVKNEKTKEQLNSAYKTAVVQVSSAGSYSITALARPTALLPSKRILQMEKYPEKTDLYNKEMNQH